MNIKELMVGDLLRVNRDGLCIKKDTIVQIRGIDGDNKFEEKGLVGYAGCQPLDETQFAGGIWLDYLDPIPLTPEILEKNGFRLTKADTVCPADRYWRAIDGTRDGAIVEITLYNPDVHGVKVLTKIHTQSSHESGVNTVHSCDIESVHELQHALRLCRIDKEIVV